MVNSKPGDTGGSKEKLRVEAVRLVLWELGLLIPSHMCHCFNSFSQNNNSAPKSKIPVWSDPEYDPIRSPMRSGIPSGFVNGRLIIILEIVYRGEHDTTNCKEKTFTVKRYGIWSTLSNLSANYIPLVHSIYSITFKPKNCSEYFRAMIRIWVMFTYLKAWLYNNMPNMDHLGEKWVFTLWNKDNFDSKN